MVEEVADEAEEEVEEEVVEAGTTADTAIAMAIAPILITPASTAISMAIAIMTANRNHKGQKLLSQILCNKDSEYTMLDRLGWVRLSLNQKVGGSKQKYTTT